MPRYNRRRTNRRKGQSTSKKIMGYAAMAVSAYKTAKYLKSLINVEVKRNVLASTGTAVPNTGTIVLWTNLAQGNLENQRNGNRIKIKSLAEHYMFLSSTASPFTTVRVITFIDKASHGAAPAVLDVLDSASWLSHYNNENAGSRFKILNDKLIDLSNTNLLHADRKFYLKMGHHITYSGTDSTQAGCLNGHVYSLFIAEYTSTNSPIVAYNNVFNYIDN